MDSFIIIFLVWWLTGWAYAVWAWRLTFDVTIIPFIFAGFVALIAGPLVGLAWHLCWYFEHHPKKIPTITLFKRRDG